MLMFLPLLRRKTNGASVWERLQRSKYKAQTHPSPWIHSLLHLATEKWEVCFKKRTVRSELRKWRISASNRMQAGHAVLRLFLQRTSWCRNETLAHARTMKCNSIQYTKQIYAIKQNNFAHCIQCAINLIKHVQNKNKNKMCSVQNHICTQYHCAKLWTIICAKQNNILCKTKQYFVQQKQQ